MRTVCGLGMERHTNIRRAMREMGVSYAMLVDKIGRTRQTINTYVNQYERTGTVSNSRAQEEFDRIVISAELKAKEGTRDFERRRAANRDMERHQRSVGRDATEWNAFIREMMVTHGFERLLDFRGEWFTADEVDHFDHYINPGDNIAFEHSLTEEERGRLRDIEHDLHTNALASGRDATVLEMLDLNELWESTVHDGRPVKYRDCLRCAITPEDFGDDSVTEYPAFPLETFCMCSGDSAVICVDDLFLLHPPEGYEFELTASISVMTDRDVSHLFSRRFEGPICGHNLVRVDGLIPGYRYLYSIHMCINLREGEEPREENDLEGVEYSYMEGYYTDRHPLK